MMLLVRNSSHVVGNRRTSLLLFPNHLCCCCQRNHRQATKIFVFFFVFLFTLHFLPFFFFFFFKINLFQSSGFTSSFQSLIFEREGDVENMSIFSIFYYCWPIINRGILHISLGLTQSVLYRVQTYRVNTSHSLYVFNLS